MMNGYDKAEALAFIVKRIHAKDHPELAFQIESLISQAIDADMDYMHKEGVLTPRATRATSTTRTTMPSSTLWKPLWPTTS